MDKLDKKGAEWGLTAILGLAIVIILFIAMLIFHKQIFAKATEIADNFFSSLFG